MPLATKDQVAAAGISLTQPLEIQDLLQDSPEPVAEIKPGHYHAAVEIEEVGADVEVVIRMTVPRAQLINNILI